MLIRKKQFRWERSCAKFHCKRIVRTSGSRGVSGEIMARRSHSLDMRTTIIGRSPRRIETEPWTSDGERSSGRPQQEHQGRQDYISRNNYVPGHIHITLFHIQDPPSIWVPGCGTGRIPASTTGHCRNCTNSADDERLADNLANVDGSSNATVNSIPTTASGVSLGNHLPRNEAVSSGFWAALRRLCQAALIDIDPAGSAV